MREDVKLFSWMSNGFKNPHDIQARSLNILSRDTCFLWELTWQTLVITIHPAVEKGTEMVFKADCNRFDNNKVH